MELLTKIERVRLSSTDCYNLAKLKSYGIHKSKFIREAIREKISRDVPKILAERKRLDNLKRCPF